MPPRIAPRMRDYFLRQIDFFERLLETAPDSSAGSAEAAQVRLAADTARMRELEEEFAALQSDYRRAADITDEESAELRALARRAGSLAEQIALRNDDCLSHIAEQIDAVRVEWDQLRRGRRDIGRYRVDHPEDLGFIDRKA